MRARNGEADTSAPADAKPVLSLAERENLSFDALVDAHVKTTGLPLRDAVKVVAAHTPIWQPRGKPRCGVSTRRCWSRACCHEPRSGRSSDPGAHEEAAIRVVQHVKATGAAALEVLQALSPVQAERLRDSSAEASRRRRWSDPGPTSGEGAVHERQHRGPGGLHRLPGESARQHHAFEHYRTAGPQRSIDKAWHAHHRHCLHTPQSKTRRRPMTRGNWSVRWAWVSRATSYDHHLEAQKRLAFETEQIEASKRHARTLQAALAALTLPLRIALSVHQPNDSPTPSRRRV